MDTNPYESPKAELEIAFEAPHKKILHLTFWIGHTSAFLIFYSGPGALIQSDVVNLIAIPLALLMLVCIIWYFIEISRYMNQLGRNGIAWGILTFIFSPLGIWISYLASFFIKPKLSAKKDSV